jgi:hypothetical protein
MKGNFFSVNRMIMMVMAFKLCHHAADKKREREREKKFLL